MPLIIAVFIFVVSFCTDVISAQETKSIPVSAAFFEDVSARNRSNIESIVTIQGEVEIEHDQYEEENVTSFRQSKTVFAVDNKRNYRLSIRFLNKNVLLENGVENKEGYCNIDGFLYMDDIAYWYYAANPNAGDPNINPLNHASVIGMIRIEQRNVNLHDNSRLPEYFNPFDRMTPSRVDPSERMLSAAMSLSHKSDIHKSSVTYSATQTGDILTVKAESQFGSKQAAHFYFFDTTKSHCLIEYKTIIDNSCYRYWSCKPILVDGIWFPSTISEFTVGGKNKKEYRFSNVKINKKIPEDVFTLQFLGARQKDHVFDARTKTESVINDPAFLLPEYLKNLEKKPISNRNWILIWILIGVGLLSIFLLIYRMFSQYF
jgi:hypothetical protein